MPRKRGVYFLANDFVLDRAVAFLGSFRRYNPSVPLCLVPYAGDVAALAGLRHRYDFTIWADTGILDTCDEISRAFHGPEKIEPKYRKLALWEGEYDEFVYIDCDTVVLASVDFVFDHLDTYAFITASSNRPDLRRLVWRDSVYRSGPLTTEQISYGATTGLVASRREHLRFADVQRRLPGALGLAAHMNLDTCEQPLLNYLIVTSGRPYTSLSAAAAAGVAGIAVERWAGLPIDEVRDGEIVSADSPPTLFVHWAGLWYRDGRDIATLPQVDLTELPNYHLWSYYRDPAAARGPG